MRILPFNKTLGILFGFYVAVPEFKVRGKGAGKRIVEVYK